MNPTQRLVACCAALAAAAVSNACESELEDPQPVEAASAASEALSASCPTNLPVAAVSASNDDGNVPANVLDGNLATRWSSEGIGQFVTLDLGASVTSCGVRLAWHQGTSRRSDFVVSSSLDGLVFHPIYTGRSSGVTTQLEGYVFPHTTARYLRVTVNGNTINDWASISEARASGVSAADAGTTSPDAAPPPSASPVAPVFDGKTGYVDLGNDVAFSQPRAGAITIEAWMRPDSLAMAAQESSGYVHWLGKGIAGAHEWTFRMYQQGNAEGRGNRTSFYAFNLTGGLGAGSYAQDTVTIGQWMHFVGVIDATSTRIFKNGVLRDSDPLSGYSIVPQHGSAPVRVATRDMNSFFQGSIGRVAIYGGALSAARIAVHFGARGSAQYDATVLGEPSLVSYWRLDEKTGAAAVDLKSGHNGTYHGGVKLAAAAF